MHPSTIRTLSTGNTRGSFTIITSGRNIGSFDRRCCSEKHLRHILCASRRPCTSTCRRRPGQLEFVPLVLRMDETPTRGRKRRRVELLYTSHTSHDLFIWSRSVESVTLEKRSYG